MSRNVLVMYAVAAALALGGSWFLLQLRGKRSERGRYQRLIAGTMLLMCGVILIGFATAMRSWEAAP